MEQTLTMDKKPQSRPPSLLCKNNQEPSKSGFDYSAKKNGSQYPRKRENEKYDNSKRFSANRGGRSGQRYVRPREKMGCQVDPKDSVSEIGSLQRSGGKKQNITHLLNWWGPGPDRHSNRSLSNDHNNIRGYRSRKHNVHVKYNKEHYLQANCQFVVAAGHDYSSYECDPDHLVDWDFIEEVRLHVSECPACPICLHPPVAAKVTRCGHIFCFSCILHYLALTDEKWRKCPICFDAVTKVDLKSVVTILHKDFTSSQEIELKLMRRDRDSLVPIPVSCFSPSLKKEPATLSIPNAVLSYSKLIVASKSEVSKFIVGREIEALRCQLALEGDQPEACFIQEALSLVSQRESFLISNPQSLPSLPEEGTPLDTTPFDESFEKGISLDEPHLDECRRECNGGLKQVSTLEQEGRLPLKQKQKEAAESPLNIHLEDLDIGQLQGNGTPTNQDGKGGPKSTFYFYQESSGAHVYLHALNVHMLVKEYGCLENCPHAIKAKVLEKESDSMTDTLRQRLRYLRHLPVTCPFEVVEIEMRPPLVSQLTVVEFQGQLEQRERKRKKRAKEEHRIEKRAQVEEDRMMGRSRGSKINMTSFKHFPSFTEDLSPPLIPEEESLSTRPVGSSSVTEDFPDMSPPSFAQMIRCGQKKPQKDTLVEAFPSLGSTTSTSSNRLTPRQESKGGVACNPLGSEDEEEEEEPDKVPDFSTAFSDAFAKALDQATKKVSESTSNDTPQRSKKGKKKKGIVLLSSGGR